MKRERERETRMHTCQGKTVQDTFSFFSACVTQSLEANHVTIGRERRIKRAVRVLAHEEEEKRIVSSTFALCGFPHGILLSQLDVVLVIFSVQRVLLLEAGIVPR